MTKPVFLSASEPDPVPNPCRLPVFWEHRRPTQLREAVPALVAYVLPRYPLVFGGHPAITPLVLGMQNRLTTDRASVGDRPSPGVQIYQSCFFEHRVPPDVQDFKGLVWTPPVDNRGERVVQLEAGDRDWSLLLMRASMIGRPNAPPVAEELQWLGDSIGRERREQFETYDFHAAMFIGGMEGVMAEFAIFRHFHPDTPAYPLASTGSASHVLFERMAESVDLMRLTEILRDCSDDTSLMPQLLSNELWPSHGLPLQPYDLSAFLGAWGGGAPLLR